MRSFYLITVSFVLPSFPPGFIGLFLLKLKKFVIETLFVTSAVFHVQLFSSVQVSFGLFESVSVGRK